MSKKTFGMTIKDFGARCCVFRAKDSSLENRCSIWMVYRTVMIFVAIEMVQQAGLYFSYSGFEEFQQGALGIILLACVGFYVLLMSYLLIHRRKAEDKYSQYKALFIYLILSCGLTAVSCEWSPWRMAWGPFSDNSMEDVSRFLHLKNFKIFMLFALFMHQEQCLRLGVVVYLIPYTYLALRFEAYSEKSLELLAIPVLVLIFAPRLFFNHHVKTQRPVDIEASADKSRLDLEENVKREEPNESQPLESHFVLLDALPEGAMILDDCGRPVHINEAILRILECNYEDAVEKVFSLADKEFLAQREKEQKREVPRRSGTLYPSSFHDRLDVSGDESILQDRPPVQQTKDQGKQFTFNMGSPGLSRTNSLTSPIMSPTDEHTQGFYESAMRKYFNTTKKPPKIMEPSPKQSNSALLRRRNEYIVKEPRSQDNLLMLPQRESSKSPTFKPIKVNTKISLSNASSRRNSIDNQLEAQNEPSLLKIPLPMIQSKFAKAAEEAKDNQLAAPLKNLRNKLRNFDSSSQTKFDSGDDTKLRDDEEITFSSIEQIAEQQALSMKPELDDLLEKLRSNNIRSSFASVGDAIQHVYLKYFKKTNIASSPNSPLMADQAWPDCMRSISDGIAEYLLAKRGSLPPSASIIINSYLKVSSTKVKYLEVKISPLLHKDQKLLLVLIRDDTQKDIARRLHLLDKQKASTLASTVHDLRAPLGAIMSSLECISSKTIDAEILESFVRPASYAAKSLMFLINDILDIHQINMKKLQLSYQKCDIRTTLSSIVEIFRLKAEMKGLELKLDVKGEIPLVIVTDPNRLQQIVINLLSNALKFTEKGSITVRAEQIAVGLVKVGVIDTGIGIQEHDKIKLFTNFGRIRNQKNDLLNPQGVGLGLVISNKLAKMLCQNDSISGLKVESAFGKGSEFSFIVEDWNSEESPQSRGSKSERMADMGLVRPSEIKRTMNSITCSQDKSIFEDEGNNFISSPIFPSRNLDKKTCKCSRVLVVDDNEFSVVATVNILKSLKIQDIEVARNGQEAIDVIMKRNSQNKCCKAFELILMDCQMPVMDGIAATTELQRLIKENQLGPQRIVGLSGYSSEEVQAQCKQAGMMKVLVKPLRMNDLKFVLQN